MFKVSILLVSVVFLLDLGTASTLTVWYFLFFIFCLIRCYGWFDQMYINYTSLKELIDFFSHTLLNQKHKFDICLRIMFNYIRSVIVYKLCFTFQTKLIDLPHKKKTIYLDLISSSQHEWKILWVACSMVLPNRTGSHFYTRKCRIL